MKSSTVSAYPLTKRKFLSIAAKTAALAGTGLTQELFADPGTEVFHPVLQKVGSKFRFVIFADPQVGPRAANAEVPHNAREQFEKAVAEVMNDPRKPDFVVHLGDLVNVAEDKSLDNWKICRSGLKCEEVLVHGNHDSHPPYLAFRKTQKEVNGIDKMFYSYDCGDWHFVIIPCNLETKEGKRSNRACSISWPRIWN